MFFCLNDGDGVRLSFWPTSVVKEVGAMSHTWELREGKVMVVEDANTASLVVVARELKDRNDKIAALEEIIRKLRT
jgi:hypothetical protein